MNFKTCPHSFKDTFKYYMISNNKLLIERIDTQSPWWLDLHVQVNNKDIIHVGKNLAGYFKIIDIPINYNFYPNITTSKVDSFIFKDLEGVFINSINLKKEDIITDSKDNLDIVTNLIYVSKLNNSTYETRFKQTVETLKSIIVHIPNTKIILLEQSNILPEENINVLLKYCHYLITYKDDSACNYYSNIQTLNKGLGEMYVTNKFLNVIKDKDFSNLFKIVGRYILSDNFNFSDFNKDIPVFKAIKGDGRLGIIVFSNFYTLPKKYLEYYLQHQKFWFSNNTKEPIEHILTLFVESLPSFKIVPSINMFGIGAETNKKIFF